MLKKVQITIPYWGDDGREVEAPLYDYTSRLIAQPKSFEFERGASKRIGNVVERV